MQGRIAEPELFDKGRRPHGMLSFLRQHAVALLCSFLLHAVLAAVLMVSVMRDPPFDGAPPAQVAIEATVVDSSRIEEEMRLLEAAEQQETREREAEAERLREQAEQARSAQQEEQRRLEELRDQREAEVASEQQRQEQLAAQRRADEEAERKRAAEQEELEAEQMAEALRQREESQRRQEELRQKQEAERARLEELERQRKEEEARLARLEEERQEQERLQREAEEARATAQREAAMREELAAEQRRMDAESSGLLAQYITLIQQQITRNWIRPPSAGPDLECSVQVTQIPSGEVVGVRVGACNGDAAVIRSIEAAVYRASPLPLPPDSILFERNLTVVFAPDS